MARQRGKISFVMGLVLGLLIGTGVTATAAALAPRIIGGSGFMFGYTVNDDSGDEICTDPYYWPSTKEIECD